MALAKKLSSKTSSKSSNPKQNAKRSSNSPERKISKSNAILHLLRRKQGASLEELQKVSGWQAHSVRGFLSGTVKKKLELKLRSSVSKNGERRYTIAAS
jgi:hypothetical protein